MIAQYIEAILFCSNEPVTVKQLQKTLSKVLARECTKHEIEESLQHLINKYQSADYAFSIVAIAGGYQFFTKAEYEPVLNAFFMTLSSKRLSTSQLETLAIIAYRQPVTKPEVERIRGVNCDFVIQKLLEKELITIVGRSDEVGKPLLYGTSRQFLNHFGINTPDDLPKLNDLYPLPGQSLGQPSEN